MYKSRERYIILVRFMEGNAVKGGGRAFNLRRTFGSTRRGNDGYN